MLNLEMHDCRACHGLFEKSTHTKLVIVPLLLGRVCSSGRSMVLNLGTLLTEGFDIQNVEFQLQADRISVTIVPHKKVWINSEELCARPCI
jgi:hypothetical protein